MLETLTMVGQADAGRVLADLAGTLDTVKSYVLMFAGFSLVIFVHELGHFVVAKLNKVRVDKFAVGFGRELFGFTKGETRYAFNILPLGGYVKMLGQEDFSIDKSGEVQVKDDPHSFTNKPVHKRMLIVSAGVVMNLVFAAAMFAVVFMIGMPSLPAEVGVVQTGMPAEQAGLRVGDRIKAINQHSISDWPDLQSAIMLSDPDQPLKIVYERTDPQTKQAKTESVTISPETTPDSNVLRVGIGPAMTTEVGSVINSPDLKPDQQLQVGDDIVAVNGKPVENYYQINNALVNAKGAPVMLTVDRSGRPGGSKKLPATQPAQRLEIPWHARLQFVPTGKTGESSGHLLGLVPRARVLQVAEGQRGDLAGFKAGDVIVRWGGINSPRLDEIAANRRENGGREIRVIVDRPGEGEKTLTLTPKSPGLFGKSAPSDGLSLKSQENNVLVVADIVPEATDTIKTPAAAIKDVMPRGALITKVNDKPVKTWEELSQQFVELAGSDVKLTWTYQGTNEQTGVLHVPQTIGTTFPLPAARQILSINGQSRIEVEVGGKRVSRSADDWLGASEILKGCVGKEVPVVYKDNMEETPRTATLKVTEEMRDTWVMRNSYEVEDMLPRFRLIEVREPNPLKASVIGLRKTYYFIEQIYLTMERMIFTRSMSVDQISGPVGIMQMGSQVAAMGTPQLLYFLALISANLAVINFLPLPIMDGGLFVFLLIEKIKGRPLSMRVQVATQLIGLALIIGIFLFVTFQDIQKLAG